MACYTIYMNFSKERLLKIVGTIIVLGGLFSIAAIVYADTTIDNSAEGKVYTNVETVPVSKTALLLGTNKYVFDGRENLFYIYRINAVVALYEAEKIEFVLISGDNSRNEYNEPELMQQDLIAAGIPEEKIYLDYAGFRTWDSVIRAHKVFLENDFVVVSQEFHNIRALYAAQANGIDAIAFNAQDVPVSRSPRIWVRERLARVKAVLDNIFNTDPKFLGETIVIE